MTNSTRPAGMPEGGGVHLYLVTECGRTGAQWLSDDGGPMIWDRDGDDPTASATFQHYGPHGALLAEHTIDGDDWRELENQGDPDRMLPMLRAGIALDKAVDALVEGVDPDGYYEDAAGAREELARVTKERDCLLDSLAAMVDAADALARAGAIPDHLDSAMEELSRETGEALALLEKCCATAHDQPADDLARVTKERDELQAQAGNAPARVWLFCWSTDNGDDCEAFATRELAIAAVLKCCEEDGYPDQEPSRDEGCEGLSIAQLRERLEAGEALDFRGGEIHYAVGCYEVAGAEHAPASETLDAHEPWANTERRAVEALAHVGIKLDGATDGAPLPGTLGYGLAPHWLEVLDGAICALPADCEVAQSCMTVMQAADSLLALLPDVASDPGVTLPRTTIIDAAARQCAVIHFG